jgi:hypothetical protein
VQSLSTVGDGEVRAVFVVARRGPEAQVLLALPSEAARR